MRAIWRELADTRFDVLLHMQQAIRASETLYKGGDRSFAADWKALAKDTDTDVAIQALMTMNTLKVADAKTVIQAAMDANKAKGVQFVANLMLNPNAAASTYLPGTVLRGGDIGDDEHRSGFDFRHTTEILGSDLRVEGVAYERGSAISLYYYARVVVFMYLKKDIAGSEPTTTPALTLTLAPSSPRTSMPVSPSLSV